MKKAQIYFTNKTKLLAIVSTSVFLLAFTLSTAAEAATGINPEVNFQGKVVNKTAGTNVTNGDYDFTFRLYDAASGGSLLWTENHTSANDVTVTDGIFRVALGSITSLSSVDFNSDSLYLDITFNGESMGTRIRFASVPYAFNAQKVNGLTVTNNGGNTLSIAASKTFTVSNSLTLTGTDSTSFAFPSTGGGTVIVTNISGQNIAGSLGLTGTSGNLSLAGTTGLTFSGTGGDITFTNGEKIDNDADGTIAVTGSLSSSGLITAGTGLTLTTGPITLGGSTGSSQCLIGGASASWGSCGSGGGTNLWQQASGGVLAPGNLTQDILFGALATSSAKFAFTGLSDLNNQTQASISGQLIVMPNNGYSGKVGIGTTAPANKLHVALGTSEIAQFNDGTSASAIWGTNIGLISELSEARITSRQTLPLVFFTGGTVNSMGEGTERMRLSNSGEFGIGVTPVSQLHVTRPLSFGATGKALAIFDQIENQDIFTASAGGTTRFVIQSDGDVGIGTALPLADLDVRGANQITDSLGNLFVSTTDALAIDKGGQLSLGGNYQTGADPYTFGSIAGRKENATDGNAAGYLSFGTLRSNGGGAVIERMRIDSIGRVGIGTTTGNSALYVTHPLTMSATGKALAIFDQIEDQDLFTASKGGTMKFVIDTNGRVGINTNSFSTNFEYLRLNSPTYTDTSGTIYMVNFQNNANPSSNSTAHFYGARNVANLTGSSEVSRIVGGYFQAYNNNTATSGNGLNEAFGGHFEVTNNTTGKISSANAGNFSSSNNSSGTISNLRGVRIVRPTNSGTITNTYGVFIQDQTASSGTQTNTPYGIYQEGTGDRNYFASILGLGTATPISQLHVTRPLSSGALGKALAIFDQIENQDIFTASASGATKFTLANDGSASMSGTLTLGGSSGIIRPADGDLSLQYKSGANAWATAMTIDDVTGFVGIKTNTPSVALQIDGADNAELIRLKSTASPDTYLSITNQGKQTLRRANGSTVNLSFETINAGSWGAGGGAITFEPNDVEAMRLTTAGLMGLGTNSPSSALHVTHPLSMSATGKALAIFDQIENQDIFTASASGTTRFTIKNSGFTGVGTAIPNTILEVRDTRPLITFNRGGSYSWELGEDDGTNSPISYFALRDSSAQKVRFVVSHTTGLFGLGTTAPISEFHVTRALSDGVTGKALAIFDQIENQDIFTASASGTMMFTIGRNGDILLGTSEGAGNSGECLKSAGAGAAANWDTCGGAGGTNLWQQASGGILAPGNLTQDILFGSLASASAKFAFLNTAGTLTPVASVSAIGGSDATKGIYLSGNGSLQSVRNNTLTLGGATTGDIYLRPANSSTSLYLNSSGQVSIGTLTPASTSKFQVEQTKTDTSGFVLAMNYNYLIANPSGASTAEYVANRNLAEIANGNAQNFTGASLIGLYNQASHRGTQTLTNAFGVQGIAKVDSTGTVTNARSFSALGQMTAVGTMTNYTGFYASTPANSGGGTYGTAYGVYVDNQNIGSAAYGVYIAGASTNALWVDTGTSRFDGTIDAQGDISDSSGNLTLNDATDISGLLTISSGLTLSGGGAITLGGSTGSGQCITGGASAAWGSCGGGSSVNLLGQANGLTWIGNTTTDFAIGGTSTASAKFVFGNINSGTPTATFSGDLIINNKPTTTVADMQRWNQITGTAGTIGGGATTAIASISASVVYNGSLYVGTNKANGAEVYRYDGISSTWTKVSNATAGTIASGGTANIDMISSMTVWNGYLYIGTSEPNAAEVYRFDGTTTWTKVSQAAAGTIRSGGTTLIDGVVSMAVFQSKLYIGTAEGAKAEIYRYETGTSWIIQNTTAGTFVTTNTVSVDAVSSMVSYQGSLYAITKKLNDSDLIRFTGVPGANAWLQMNAGTTTSSYNIYNTESGAAGTVTNVDDGQMVVYAGRIVIGFSNYGSTSDILMWTPNEVTTTTNTFIRLNAAAGQIATGGTSNIDSITAMTIYGGRLYIGTGETNLAQIYRYDGALGIWTLISQNTAGQINSGGTTGIDSISTLISFNHNSLFAGILEGTATQGYMYNSSIDQSYALKFNAAGSQAGGEQNLQENLGSIFFVASLSANLNNRQGNSGAFVFSHNIVTNNGSYDVAEDYPTRDDSLEPGDVVAVDTGERGFVKKSEGAYDYSSIGIYSENPGIRLSQQSEEINGGRVIPVALAGRVPVKVSTENGNIKSGDALTSSSKPGVAMKAKKAGVIIGVALADYDGEGVGKITAYVKSSSYNGDAAQVFAGLDVNSESFAADALAQLMTTETDGKSSVATDRLIAGLEVITPRIVADTIIARLIKAEELELPEDFFKKAMKSEGFELENKDSKELAALKEQVSVLNAQTKDATKAAELTRDKLLESINEKLSMASMSATEAPEGIALKDLNINGLMVFNDSIRVKNNGLFEGILTVIDTIYTDNLIANGISTFFGKSLFKDDVEFEKQVVFSNDIGGQALIKKDAKKVEIKFDNEFEVTPIINVSVSFDEQKDEQGNVIDDQALIDKYFDQKYSYLIVGKSSRGFSIVLDKKAEDDIYFTWTVLKVKDAKTIQSRAPN